MKKIPLLLVTLFIFSCGSKEPFRMNMGGPSIAMPMVPCYTRGPVNTTIPEGPIAFDVPQATTLNNGMQIPSNALLEGYFRAHGNRVYFAPAIISYVGPDNQPVRIQLNSYQTGLVDLRTDSSRYGEMAGKGAIVGGVVGGVAGALTGDWRVGLIGLGAGAGVGAAAGATNVWMHNNDSTPLPAQTGMMLHFQ